MSEPGTHRDTSAANITTKSTMATDKTFQPPKIPQTPSKTINSMLEMRCGHTFDNAVKAGVAYFICGVFQAITMLYTQIKAKSQQQTGESHRLWMVSCGAVSSGIVLVCYLVYKLILACSFLIYGLLYYGVLAVALSAIGLGVSGAVFFDKDGSGKSTNVAGSYTSSSHSSSGSSAYGSARQRFEPQ